MTVPPTPGSLERAIDALYQLPLGAFTARRNALAKTQADAARERVRKLSKPAAVPWTVNQLYWRDRALFDRLMKAGAALRKAQVDAIEGRRADVATATAAHREALTAALSRAESLAAAQSVHAAAEPLARMLEAASTAAELPELPGRFTAVVRPSGFEAMAGVVPSGRKLVVAAPGRAATKTKDERHASLEADRRRREHEAAVNAARRAVSDAEAAESRALMRLNAARDQLAERESALREARAEVKKAQSSLSRVERSPAER
jgi:hypothetical protein